MTDQPNFDKICSFMDGIFTQMADFVEQNADVTRDGVVRTLCFDIGLHIAQLHEHWFRANRHQTLRHYQEWMRIGLEKGWENLMKEEKSV